MRCTRTYALALAGVLLVGAVTAGGCSLLYPRRKSDDLVKVGLLMATHDQERWAREEAIFQEKAEERGIEVLHAVADDDQTKQNIQTAEFLDQGVKALVVVPVSFRGSARIVPAAHTKRVPVLAYDRLIGNPRLDMYVTFDSEKVGYLQAQGVLKQTPEGNVILLGGPPTDYNSKPLRHGQLRAISEHAEKTGQTVNIVARPYLETWSTEEARKKVHDMLVTLKAIDQRLDAIIASNDAQAAGAIAALEEAGLAGKVAVSGQDADLAACRRVVQGTQTVTVYKPVAELADVAANIAYRLARNWRPLEIANALKYRIEYTDVGDAKVPTVLLEPQVVTKDNMVDTVVKNGWHTMAEVYANVPESQRPKPTSKRLW